MAGKEKYAARMSKLLGEPIDAACPITRPGGTARQLTGAMGGAMGAALASVDKTKDSDVAIGQFAWLGLGTTHFAITKASVWGRPKGEPLARIAYTDVTSASVTEGKLTLRADLDLADGRHVAFEIKRHGQGKPSVEVLELLHARCPTATA